MITPIIITFTILLIIFSILDLKFRSIPSVFLTATIIALTFTRFENFRWAVTFGLIGFLLWEFSDEKFGVADIKVMIMMGFFINNIGAMIILLLIFAVGQFVYISFVHKFAKFEEIPFIPMFLAIWIGGIIGGIFV